MDKCAGALDPSVPSRRGAIIFGVVEGWSAHRGQRRHIFRSQVAQVISIGFGLLERASFGAVLTTMMLWWGVAVDAT